MSNFENLSRQTAYTEIDHARKPFLIRAHHVTLPNILYIVDPEDAEERAEAQLEYYLSLYQGAEGKDGILYAKDVLGSNLRESVPHYLEKTASFAREYASLADDYPVHLTRLKDTSCEGCAIGSHCLADQGDDDAMWEFIATARWRNLQEGTDYALFLDEHNHPARIETTKGTVVAIVASRNYLEAYTNEQYS